MKRKERFTDEGGKVFSCPPQTIIVDETKFEIQDVEDTLDGKTFWWHFHKA